ncbi:alpha-amylase family protein [Cellulomonas sp.]|uniref:alpha-amylase n=1 Tax=Cellulomonas sp. TaxID=40001 RepID=UPI001B1A4874|nr:alpha-amylase family protein [Cellulomonas sp.]MBO9553911.1 alpha-amylase family protein [Cellulomonas sp.]
MTHLFRTSARTALAVALLAGSLAACTPADPGAEPATDGSGHDVGVELFQWTWDAIAAECTDHLGPDGYAWVLTSPPQEHILGDAWWTAYQPVSYRVESRLGTREQYAAMVETCHDAGVEVWADAVVNHMTGEDVPGTGWAGSAYEHYAHAGLYDDADFHHCALTPDDDIHDYADAAQVQTCELVNLADLATETPHVRETVTAYLSDLLTLGVDGFRIDAAKHMPPADVAAIVAGLPERTGIVQEVIRGAGEPVTPEQYTANGKVFEFAWGRDVQGVLAGSPDLALDLGSGGGYLPSDDAVVFVDNHDTERNGSTLSYRDGATYVLANVLMLAGTYGTPTVYSGYAFDDSDLGPAQDADGRVLDATCADAPGPDADLADDDWVCQHRWSAIAGMVGWRGVVGDAPLVDRWSDGDALALGRGERGLVVVNAGDDELSTTLTTRLPDGRYCDVLASGCEEVTVRDGAVEVRVAPHSARAWDVATRP